MYPHDIMSLGFYINTNNISTASTCHIQWLSFISTPTLSHGIHSHIIALGTHIETNTIPTVTTCLMVCLHFIPTLVLSRTTQLPYCLQFSCQVLYNHWHFQNFTNLPVSSFYLLNFHHYIPFFHFYLRKEFYNGIPTYNLGNILNFAVQ
jgi:hypothetical protein